MTATVVKTPIDILKVQIALEYVHGGDLVLGNSLQDYVSGEITREQLTEALQQPGRAFLPLIAAGLNGFTAVKRLRATMGGFEQLSDLEHAARYRCPYTEMTPWGLVPMGILATDASIYKDAFNAPGFWAYLYDMATDERTERHVESFFGGFDETLDSALTSVTVSMLGSGYIYGCSSDDGSNQRQLVTVDLTNGDKLICVAWIWLNR